MSEDIKVRRFKCLCGKTRMVTAIQKDKPFTKSALKSMYELEKAGCEMDIISLEEARKVEFCFECKLDIKV